MRKKITNYLLVISMAFLFMTVFSANVRAEENTVSPVKNLTLSNSTKWITVTWEESKDAEEYRVYRKDGSNDAELLTTIEAGKKLQFLDKDMKGANGKLYKYTVRACKDGKVSDPVTKKIVRLTTVKPYGETRYKKMTVRWTKNLKGSGYQIKYGTKRSFSGAKIATVSGAKVNRRVFNNMPRKKTYYVRVRAYKKIGNVTYYSAWSNVVFGTIL